MRGFIERWVLSEGRIGRALVAFMALGFLALLVAGFAAVWATNRGQEHTRWVNHTYDVSLALGAAQALVERGEASRRGFLLTGADRYLAIYAEARRGLAPTLDRLARLTADNPRQAQRVAALDRSVGALHAQRDATIRLIQAGQVSRAREAFAAEGNTARLRGIRDLLRAMQADEAQLLAGREAAQQRIVRTFYTIVTVAGIVLALVALASLLAVLSYTRDIAASRDSLHRLNDTLEDEVAARTADLTRANEEIQRFAYIVSHDLRSPLVNVMGFTAELSAATGELTALVDRAEAEAPALLTEEARLAAREDLPEAIGFIRASTAKMDRLINAILTLSRQGRRTLAPEPLDLAALSDAIVAAMRHTVDERGITIEVERPMPPVVNDRLAVEQILSNLVENATKYLQPGRPGHITVSATRAAGRVVVAVADNGRGIDQRDHQRIFDLFRRSGQQDQPGEGIGLAHVRALAYRLGGTVTVESKLGEGATFRLSLPATPQQEPAP